MQMIPAAARGVANCTRMPNDEFSRLDFVRLDKNENASGFPEELLRTMLAQITPDQMASYPEPFLLKRRLAEFLNIDGRCLTLASGSDGAIKNCFEAFINPGDGVIYLNPTYAMVGVYVQLFQARGIGIGYNADLQLDMQGLIDHIEPGVKMIYLANPNSPTGTLIAQPWIERCCERAAQVGALVLVDEAYHYFTPETSQPLLNKFENLVITRTFSKVASIAAVRLGYSLASPEVAALMAAWRPMYEINFFAQHCGIFVLDHWDEIIRHAEEVIATRAWFLESLRTRGLTTFESHTNFVLALYDRDRIGDAVAEFKRRGVLIKGGGSDFPLSSCLRFGIGSRAQMERCLDILTALDNR